MPQNKSTGNISWSRHMGLSPASDQGADCQDVVARARKNLQKIKAATKRSGISMDPRKATSECNLWNGGNLEGGEEESWDSQSDPGSMSSKMSNGFTPGRFSPAKQIGVGDDGHSGAKPLQKKNGLQGRGKSESAGLRRRKEIRDDSGVGGPKDFVLEIPEELVPLDVHAFGCQTPQYLHSYYDFMYYSCLSTYKWDKKEDEDHTKCQYALSIFQKVITFYIAILATFSSFIAIKQELVSFLDERTLTQFIDIGYFMVSCAIHWYFTYFFMVNQEAVSKTLKIWDDYENDDTNTKCIYKNQTEWLPIVNGIVTILMAIIKSSLYTDFENWSFERLLLLNSEDVSNGFFIWKPDHLNNSTLLDDYGTNLNTSSYFMGILGIMGNFCWHLQIGCSKDVLIWVAIVNKHHVLKFGEKIQLSLSQKMSTGKNVSENDDRCWQAYRDIQGVNSCTNATYNTMFMINHLDSFLVFSYWLTELLNKKVKLRVLILIGYSVLKGILAYYPALGAAGKNDECRDWIQSLPCQTERFVVGETSFTREVMLMELEKKPLGLGRGKVHINNEFLVSFLTVVASLFCFLLQLQPKNEEEFRY